MKKGICSVLSLLLCVLMLAACQNSNPDTTPTEKPFEPENALQLWEKINTTMDALESYETDNTAKVVYYYMGYEFELELIGKTVMTTDAHYEETETVISCAEIEMDQTMKMMQAYHDGTMYMANSVDTYDQKFCSGMTFAEYKEEKTGDLTEDISIIDCTEAAFSKSEDGLWKLECSGYTKKTINKVLGSMELPDDQLGASIEDMRVALVADKDFHAQKIELSLVFTEAEGEPLPEFSIVAQYSRFNTAVFDSALLKTEEFTQVDDVRILEKVEDALEERQAATSGKFTLELNSTSELMGHAESSSEKDSVSYGKENGAYYYDITAELNGQQFTMQYRNGLQTVTSGGESQTAAQAETDAKAFIDGLIDSAKYNPMAVTAIEKKDEGVYLFHVAQQDVSAYEHLFVGLDVEITAAAQQITVTLDNGHLAKIESKISLDGTYRYDTGSTPITTVIGSVVTFEGENQSV